MMSTNVGVDTATAAARRRQRRLRSWLRHERMTVAMLLAERDHHTAPRGQKQARSGGVEHEVNYEPRLLDPPLPQEAATVGYVAALVPSLSLPVLADRAAEVVDSSSLRYLTAAAMRQREEEERQKRLEEREEAKKMADEMQSLLAVPRDLRTPAQLRRFQELAAQSSDSWFSLRRKILKLLPLVVALVVDSGSGIFALLVLRAMFLFLCSFWFLAGS